MLHSIYQDLQVIVITVAAIMAFTLFARGIYVWILEEKRDGMPAPLRGMLVLSVFTILYPPTIFLLPLEPKAFKMWLMSYFLLWICSHLAMLLFVYLQRDRFARTKLYKSLWARVNIGFLSFQMPVALAHFSANLANSPESAPLMNQLEQIVLNTALAITVAELLLTSSYMAWEKHMRRT